QQRAPGLRRDGRVLGAQRGAGGGAVIDAARLLGQLVERGGIELRALDRDDVDRRARLAGGRDRIVQRGRAASLVPVGDDDDYSRLERFVGERVRGLDDRVVERGGLDGVALDSPGCADGG